MDDTEILQQLESYLTTQLTSLVYELNNVKERAEQLQKNDSLDGLKKLLELNVKNQELTQKIIVYSEVYEELSQLKSHKS